MLNKNIVFCFFILAFPLDFCLSGRQNSLGNDIINGDFQYGGMYNSVPYWKKYEDNLYISWHSATGRYIITAVPPPEAINSGNYAYCDNVEFPVASK